MAIRRYNTEDTWFDAGNSGTTKTLDWADSRNQLLTLTDNCTLTLSNPRAGEIYILRLVQDGTGGRTITWPGSVSFGDAGAPTLSGANKTDVINLLYNGTSYEASYATGY